MPVRVVLAKYYVVEIIQSYTVEILHVRQCNGLSCLMYLIYEESEELDFRGINSTA